MHLLYDGMIYVIQTAGGVNRYFSNLISRLPGHITPHLTTCTVRNVNFPSHPRLRVHRFSRFRPAGLSYRLEKLYFDRIAAGEYALAHPTYYTLLTRRDVCEYRYPIVITVWDMIHELFPEEDPNGRNAEIKRKAITAADVVLCISENTKRDLLERYKSLSEDRVKVTHLASEIDEKMGHGTERVPERPYLLYVGLRYSYKNFAGLLWAFARARQRCADLMLCVVGAPMAEAEGKLMADLGIMDAVEYYGYVPDSHLAKLYRCSFAFVYPSLYEGFGIPPLEAMACGAPVIASNRSSLPEVIGDAGLLFDPDHPEDLVEMLVSLSSDEIKRAQLIARGRERAREFSWDKTAAATFRVYRDVSGRESLYDEEASPSSVAVETS